MPKQVISDILLILIAAVWGISFVLTKNVLELMPPFTFMAFRFVIASLVMYLLYHNKFRAISLSTLKKGLFQGCMLFIGIAFQIFGLQYTSASNSAFITGLSVVFVPIISSVMLKKRPKFTAILGVGLSFLGLFFLSGGYEVLSSSGLNIGDLLCLIGALGFSMHIILIDKYSENENSIVLSMLQISIVAVLSSIFFLALPSKPVILNFSIVFVLLLTGILGTAVAYSVQNYAQSGTTPTHTAMIIAAEPMFGVFFAVIIPNSMGVTEALTFNTVVGCVCILLAIFISELNFNFRISIKQGR